MRVLVVGSGGVGAAFAAIAQRRPVFTRVVLADVALERAQAVSERLGEPDRRSRTASVRRSAGRGPGTGSCVRFPSGRGGSTSRRRRR
ncbi:MAG TPA: saccharopine dehydrogenase NADP-binding domain-containing protein [Solirubrobacteraceae bacterium]